MVIWSGYFLAAQIGDFNSAAIGDFRPAYIGDFRPTLTKDAISKAAQYDTIKSVSASEIDILREYESHGFIGDYVKLYTKAYDESLESGESSLKDALLIVFLPQVRCMLHN